MLIWNLLGHTFLSSNDHLKIKYVRNVRKIIESIQAENIFVEVILYISKFFIPVFALGPAVIFVHIDRVIDNV